MSGGMCVVKFSLKDKKILKIYGRSDILSLHKKLISEKEYERIEKVLHKYYNRYYSGDLDPTIPVL